MIMPKNGLNEEARESLNDFQIQLSDAHAGPWHRFWSAALLILFLACPAFGTTYYLDIDATGNNDGSTEEHAWESWADANTGLDALGDDGADDTLLVKTGNYGAIPDDGVLEKPRTGWLKIHADTGETPVFTGMLIVRNDLQNMYLEFDGIDFAASAPILYNACMVRVRYGSQVKFLNCNFIGNGYNHITEAGGETGKGLYLEACANVEIDECEMYGDGTGDEPWMGFYYGINGRSCDNVDITDCTIQECGIAITAWGDSWTIARNHVYDGTVDGCQASSVANFVFEDNHFHDFRRPPENEIEHNDCLQLWSAGGVEPGSADYYYTENVYIRRNRMYNSGGQIMFWNSFTPDDPPGYEAENIVVENNLMYSAGLDSAGAWEVSILGEVTCSFINNTIIGSFLVRAKTELTMKNNIMNIVDFELNKDDPPTIVYEDYNLIRTWWVSMPGYEQGANTTAVSTEGAFEALFANHGGEDFTLAADSTGIDFGDSADAPVLDVLGNARDETPDAGCYEYDASAPVTKYFLGRQT